MATAVSAHFELQKPSSETDGWRHGLYVHVFLQSMKKQPYAFLTVNTERRNLQTMESM